VMRSGLDRHSSRPVSSFTVITRSPGSLTLRASARAAKEPDSQVIASGSPETGRLGTSVKRRPANRADALPQASLAFTASRPGSWPRRAAARAAKEPEPQVIASGRPETGRLGTSVKRRPANRSDALPQAALAFTASRNGSPARTIVGSRASQVIGGPGTIEMA